MGVNLDLGRRTPGHAIYPQLVVTNRNTVCFMPREADSLGCGSVHEACSAWDRTGQALIPCVHVLQVRSKGIRIHSGFSSTGIFRSPTIRPVLASCILPFLRLSLTRTSRCYSSKPKAMGDKNIAKRSAAIFAVDRELELLSGKVSPFSNVR